MDFFIINFTGFSTFDFFASIPALLSIVVIPILTALSLFKL
jgi:hypothetical protein